MKASESKPLPAVTVPLAARQSAPYVAPAIEATISQAAIQKEIHYAGVATSEAD